MKPIHKLVQIAALVFGLGLAAATPATAEQYALMIGIDDYSHVGASDLPGCTTDVRDLKKLLETQFKFPSANIVVLTNGDATKAKILSSLDELIAKAKPGDTVIIYYSGHGSQVPDLNDDDEVSDNLDEALITTDFNAKNPDTWLLDDHLRASLSRLQTKRALVLLDACHSGTGTRSLPGGKKVINKRAEFGFEKMLGRGKLDKAPVETATKSGAPSSHVLLSGCEATEVSAMAEYDGQIRSLFTTALIRVLPQMTTASLTDLTAAVHQEMKRMHPEAAEEQHPQLETTLNVTVNVLVTPGSTVDASGNAASEPLAQPNDEMPVQRPGDGLPSAFPVSVVTDKLEYRPGETMVATVMSEKAGYLRLYYVNKDGEAALIFPNHYQRDNRIEGKQRIEIGGADHPFLFRMTEPGGTELLLAAVSPEQFTDHDALDFSEKKPVMPLGKATSIRQLVDRGAKDIQIEARPHNSGGSSPVRPVQIGRGGCIYHIVVD